MCYSLWYNALTMLSAGGRSATSWVPYTTSCNTQSSVPEDGQNNCPKPVELTGIINKPLLLHLVGCLYYIYFIIFFRFAKHSQFIPLQNVVYFITLLFLVRKIFPFYVNYVLLFNENRLHEEYGELLIMPANSRRDLIRRLKVKLAKRKGLSACVCMFVLC